MTALKSLMADEEVLKWLDSSEGEDVGFVHAIDDCRPGDAEAYRRLAEARKILASCDPHTEHATRCRLCGESLLSEHADNCIFSHLSEGGWKNK